MLFSVGLLFVLKVSVFYEKLNVVWLLMSLIFLVLFSGGGVNVYMWDLSMVGIYMDLMSLMFLVLSCCIILLMEVMSLNQNFKKGSVVTLTNIYLLIFLLFCFLSKKVIIMYICFEAVLVPLFLLILMEGGGFERLVSSYYLMMYTFFGSFFMLLFLVMGYHSMEWGFMCQKLNMLSSEVDLVWCIMYLMFLVKLPIYGFHLWLPYAHVEASVSGSMILAGVILKLGGFGMLRLFDYLLNSLYLKSMMGLVGVYGGILVSLICSRQVDIKKLIAYSSVVHMGVMLISLTSGTILGAQGSLGMMMAHGLSSSALFYLVGVVYNYTGTRNMLMMKGMFKLMGGLMWMWMILVFINMGVPPFMNFFAELLIIMVFVKCALLYLPMLFMIFIMGAIYNLYMFMWVSHGSSGDVSIKKVSMIDMFIIMVLVMPLGMYLLKISFIMEWI